MKNIFRFASLLSAAVMLFACEQLDNDLFQLRVDKTLIKADGSQNVVFDAIYDQVDVTSEVAVYYKDYDEDGKTLLEGYSFSTDKEGLYKFWAEYKGVSDTVVVMATKDGNSWPISMSLDRDVIQSNGADQAKFTVLLNKKYDITSQAKLYDEKQNELSHDAGKFTTDKAGEYNVYAEYGTDRKSVV